jgi:uncharacterized protein YdhG (YjbR/CyaY superfamily)
MVLIRPQCTEKSVEVKDKIPEAATSTMLAMTGFSFERALISLHIKSEARADPPGESTLITTAFTDGFSLACLTCQTRQRIKAICWEGQISLVDNV